LFIIATFSSLVNKILKNLNNIYHILNRLFIKIFPNLRMETLINTYDNILINF